MDNNGEEEQRKSNPFLYFLYVLIFTFFILFVFQVFFSEEAMVSIDTFVTQNVEENLNCECKIFFSEENKTIQPIVDEKFTLQKYGSKEFSHKIIGEKKKIIVFEECYCSNNNNTYEQSKLYMKEITSDKISFDFAFLKNNTSML